MPKIWIVDTIALPNRTAFLVGLIVAWGAVVLRSGLDMWYQAWGPWEVIQPLKLLVAFGYPLVAVYIAYRRLPSLKSAFAFALGYGTSWHLTGMVMRRTWPTFHGPLGPQAVYILLSVGVGVAVVMIAWGLCRLLRGRVVIQDGTLCRKCGYSLVGNVSGTCPECGTPAVSAPR